MNRAKLLHPKGEKSSTSERQNLPAITAIILALHTERSRDRPTSGTSRRTNDQVAASDTDESGK